MGFKMRSGNKPNFKELGSSPFKGRTSAAYGRDRDEDFESYGDGADVSHRRRTNFEHPADTKEGQAERRAHQRHLERRSRMRLSSDLKKDRRQSQLRGPGGERDTRRGISEITDPWGNKHRVSRKGGELKFTGSTWGYDEKSREWRRNYGKTKAKDPSPRDKKIDTSKLKTTKRGYYKDGKSITKKEYDALKAIGKKKKKSIDLPKPKSELKKKPTTVSKPKKEGTRGDAFKAARAAGKAKFTYKGKEYHTRRADETKAEWQKKFGTKAKSPGKEPKKVIKKDKPKVSLKKNKGLMKSKTNVKIKKVSLKGKGGKGKSLKEKLEELKKK